MHSFFHTQKTVWVEGLLLVFITTTAVWNLTLCRLLPVYQCFRRPHCCPHLQARTLLWKTDGITRRPWIWGWQVAIKHCHLHTRLQDLTSQNMYKNCVITHTILCRVWLEHIKHYFSIKRTISDNSKFWTLCNNTLLTVSSSLYCVTTYCWL